MPDDTKHFIELCSCGTIIRHCGCGSEAREAMVVLNGCPECQSVNRMPHAGDVSWVYEGDDFWPALRLSNKFGSRVEAVKLPYWRSTRHYFGRIEFVGSQFQQTNWQAGMDSLGKSTPKYSPLG